MSRHAASPVPPPPSPPARNRHGGARLRAVRRDPLLAVAAFASLGAGAVHAAVTPEHTDWWATVVFFAGLAAFQIGWSVLIVLRPARPALLLGAAVNIGALATWVISRTIGMPFGPSSGVAETAARADVIASALGAVVVVVALSYAWRGAPVRRLNRVRPMWATGGGGLTVSALSIVALTGVSGHGHAGGDDHGAHGVVASQAAAVTAATAPDAAAATCRRVAKIEVDAAFAKAVSVSNGKAAAVSKAERAATKQLKRALANCAPARVAAPSDPVAPAAEDEPHVDDGHDH